MATKVIDAAVIFDRFGPYHQARLKAAANELNLVAVELCGHSQEYAWESVRDTEEVRRVTLLPNADSASTTGADFRRQVSGLLDDVQPRSVAVPGWSSPAALSALAWCGKNGCPAIIMSESTRWDEPRRAWKEMIKRRVVGRWGTTGLVGGSPQADYMVELGMPRERVFTGYDAVDNDYFELEADKLRPQAAAVRARLGLPLRYFLASNRFIEKKNLKVLLAAYATYQRQNGESAWSLVLLGDGPLRSSLESQRAELGLEKSVLLPGFKQYDELPAYYALADGFVHASTTEQWGLVVNEAMASALPVLVSNRCGCTADLITEGEQGWTFDPFDEEAITKAFNRLAVLPDEARRRMGKAARARVERWGPEAFAKGLARAVNAARELPARRPGMIDRMLIAALLHR